MALNGPEGQHQNHFVVGAPLYAKTAFPVPDRVTYSISGCWPAEYWGIGAEWASSNDFCAQFVVMPATLHSHHGQRSALGPARRKRHKTNHTTMSAFDRTSRERLFALCLPSHLYTARRRSYRPGHAHSLALTLIQTTYLSPSFCPVEPYCGELMRTSMAWGMIGRNIES